VVITGTAALIKLSGGTTSLMENAVHRSKDSGAVVDNSPPVRDGVMSELEQQIDRFTLHHAQTILLS
jgi:hypothetical protein